MESWWNPKMRDVQCNYCMTVRFRYTVLENHPLSGEIASTGTTIGVLCCSVRLVRCSVVYCYECLPLRCHWSNHVTLVTSLWDRIDGCFQYSSWLQTSASSPCHKLLRNFCAHWDASVKRLLWGKRSTGRLECPTLESSDRSFSKLFKIGRCLRGGSLGGVSALKIRKSAFAPSSRRPLVFFLSLSPRTYHPHCSLQFPFLIASLRDRKRKCHGTIDESDPKLLEPEIS